MGVCKIIHADMDALYASVEQRDDPRLRGKPVIVAWKGNRSVVCAASYEARAFGVRSPMPAKRADRLRPDATFVAPDFTRYRAVSQEAREIFNRHTDLIEPLSLDEAYLGVTTNKTGNPGQCWWRTIRELIRKELSLTASARVVPNKFLAKLASRTTFVNDCDCQDKTHSQVPQPADDISRFTLPITSGGLCRGSWRWRSRR
jgi:DNA polymerase-4